MIYCCYCYRLVRCASLPANEDYIDLPRAFQFGRCLGHAHVALHPLEGFTPSHS